jgi:RHS repeat-associated protein
MRAYLGKMNWGVSGMRWMRFGGVRLDLLIVVFVSLVWGCMSPGALGAGSGRVFGSVSAGGLVGDSGMSARLRAEALAKLSRRQHWLAGSVARAQRVASRMVFHDSSPGVAARLLLRDYGSALAGVGANPAASLTRSGQLVRYLSDDRALVRTSAGLRVLASSVPLRVAGGGGPKRAVDLRLRSSGARFEPVRSLAAVSIAQDSAGGVAVGGDGVRIALEGKDVAGSVLDGQEAFFGNVGVDADATVAATVNGVDLSVLLRSRLSPQLLRYRVSLPAGAVLRADASGAVVARGAQILARIARPSASDAQGSMVPVAMRVLGNELLVSVPHRDRDLAYPILVDPNITVQLSGSTSEGWVFQHAESHVNWVSGPLSISASATFPIKYEGGESFSGEGDWVLNFSSHPVNATRVEFLGVKGSTSATGKGFTFWRLFACGSGTGYSSGTPPTTVVASGGELKCNELEDPWLTIGLEFLGSGAEVVTDSGSISAESVVMMFKPTPQEEEEMESGGWGDGSEGAPHDKPCLLGKPVDCATGNEVESQSDLTVGGRGPVLKVIRTYNSQRAALQAQMGTRGPFGYGWTGTDSAYLTFPTACWRLNRLPGTGFCEKRGVDVHEDNGSALYFDGVTGGPYTAGRLVQATLVAEGGDYIYTLPNQTKLTFNSAGQLLSRTDRNGNAITITRNSEGAIETVSDGAGRKLTYKYNAEKEVESVTDPLGHTTKYAYEAGNLVSVTEPGEASPRWQFKYNPEHELTEVVDGRGHAVTNEYEAGRVIRQVDALSRERHWSYAGTEAEPETTITEPNGSSTVEKFNELGLPVSVIRAKSTGLEAKTTFEYDGSDNLIAVTDANKHTIKYGYDAHGNRTKMIDANEHETKWTYDSTHDVETITTPRGETTTIKRDSHGNAESVSRPAPKEATQTTKYAYDSHGDVESMTDPLGRVWKYEYDSYGDRTAEIDPETDKRTWGYNEDSQETSTVSPRGNVTGGEPAAFTTTMERDAQGRPLTLVEPPREPVYSFAFGSSGTGNGQFQFPTLETLTSSGNLWVSDSTLDRLQEFNVKGEYLTQFGSKGTSASQFNFPFGIAINASSGNIYVSDRNNFRVQEFSATGTFVRMFGYGVSDGEAKFEICTASCRVGLKGSGAGQFLEPDGVAIDASGNVWVVDEVNNRLEEFNEKGEFLHQYGTKGTGNGQLSQPVGIVYDNGNLYVTEATNERVQEFSTAGAYVAKFGSEGTGNGQFKVPYAISAGPVTNDLYVTDRENNRVEVFTAAGQFLRSIGSKGKGNGQMELPTGVVATTSEALYVSDHGNERVQDWTGPSPRTTKYAYDADGNPESVTDPNGNKTKYTYNADNQPIKVTAPNGTVTETGYDGAGNVTSQTDGNKHETKYVRNILGEVTEVTDPLGRKTTKEYDKAGNLKTLTDPATRTTTYTYDPANRLTEVSYSDGKTHADKYEYDADGDRTSMVDGTGTTTYGYDQLDRLTESKDGHGDTTGYEYDLANEQTKTTYPNGKAVTLAYDKAARLEKITDWLEHTTTFAYDPDSNLITVTFPTGTSNVDKYTYNESDETSEAKMTKGTETLASLLYTRDSNGQINKTLAKGLPGSETTEYAYDENNRLTKAGTTPYEYDPANNPTKTGTSTNTYDNADQLKTGTGQTYTYDELGERTKTTPTTGPATTYGYDQAGNLTSAERPKEGETPEIKDTYTYDGNGLRASQTISGTTSYLTWDMTKALPLILNDGTNNYIFGPGGLPVEQITSAGTVTYLHHDQQGSTRLLTGSTGTVTGSTTFDAYGNKTGSTGSSTTPLGYDAQYTSTDTGLIYLRARVYDPATAQFMSVDPAVPITRALYTYANDNPLNLSDPSGLSVLGSLESVGEGVLHAGINVVAVGPYAVYYGGHELARGINQLGEEFGLPGEVIAHLNSLSLVQLQALGLAGDAAIDALKNQLFGHESICDEGRGSTVHLNPLHSYAPIPGEPVIRNAPGIGPNGEVEIEW